jgi:hypothetical protein
MYHDVLRGAFNVGAWMLEIATYESVSVHVVPPLFVASVSHTTAQAAASLDDVRVAVFVRKASVVSSASDEGDNAFKEHCSSASSTVASESSLSR